MNVPNHERKAFRDMTPEERSGIVEAWIAGQLEVLKGFDWLSWYEESSSYLRSDGIYRTRPRKLVIPWEHIKPECKFAALQGTGEVWFYEIEPELRAEERGAWWFGRGARCWESVLAIDTSGIDPVYSLTARPEGV